MKTPEEKRWDMIQQYIFADSQGKTPIRISSKRTLFGIKSSVEEVIERTVAEDEEKRARTRNASKVRAHSQGDDGSGPGNDGLSV